ncbi:zinc finger and SCAN domain-containing protein 21-like [Gymnogyps californianus]|uniref:zinc finger and SCAN domain-containing protein 21-like n=1 Tax=Gymnogyps californianus TaxID=33616 RepID=UPI0021C68F1E|nr:zinc finger and SCAN domain-containing protein 21-like [Gymnogyps californianus]
MEPVIESVFSLLQEPGKSDIAGYTGNCILSDNEEERGIPEDLKQDVLPQLPEAYSPDRGAASRQRQQRAACNKPPQQKRGCKKLALIADGQKPHTEEKPYKCADCGKGFKGRSRLLNHLQTHMREKMFECVECGKSFSRKANLVMHQRIHTGERPYKCKECEKTFSRTSNLIAHRKTHVKKKAFSCTTCRKSFSGSAALFQHQRVHIDEKPYRCTECGNSFLLCSNFIKHPRIHLRERLSEHTADANHSEFTSLHHKEEQRCGAGTREMDHSNLVFEELKKMRENMDMLLLNQQSQLQVLQEIQKQLNILLPGNDLINSNVYSLGLLLGRQAAAAASLSFPLLNPSSLLPENSSLLSRSSAPGILPTTHLPVSPYPAASTT